MDKKLERRLAQLAQMTRDGTFGEKAQQASVEWDTSSPQGIAVFQKIVSDFYLVERSKDDEPLYTIANRFCQLLIVAYRNAKKQDKFVANEYVRSFVRDFDAVEGSCLYPQWEGLVKASFALKQVGGNKLLVERQAFELYRAFNEFLNATLPYLIVAWRTALGKTYSPKIFSQTYAAKLNEFRQLTNGNDGAFYIIFRLANPKLRNAIAHSDVWIDEDDGKVKYTDGKDQKIPYEISLVDFMAHLAAGSHLAQSYLAAMSVIAISESGSSMDVVKLPTHIVKLLLS